MAADWPRERWGDLKDPATIGPAPLDLQQLLATVGADEPRRRADPALVVGHLHLHVGDVEEALRFHRDVVGFEVQTQFPSAAFVSVGGYHHHLAFNTWRGEGVPPAPGDAAGLRRWTVLLDPPDLDAVGQRVADAGIDSFGAADGNRVLVRDPWNNVLLLAARGA